MADIKRMNYFDGQFLRAQDFQDEAAYELDKRWRHNNLLHTTGVAKGLNITGRQGDNAVTVTPGTAIAPDGREIVLSDARSLSMAANQASADVYIVYDEKPTDPSPDPGIVGFTRITESPIFALVPPDNQPANGVLLATVPLDKGTVRGNIADRRTFAGSPLGDLSITEQKLGDGSVSSRTIQKNAVTNEKLSIGSVKRDNIVDGEVIESKLGDGSVSNRTIQKSAVKRDNILDGEVIETKLADNSVSTRTIQKNAVTNEKLSFGAVRRENIADGEVLFHKLALNTFSGAFNLRERTSPDHEKFAPVESFNDNGINFYLTGAVLSSVTGPDAAQVELALVYRKTKGSNKVDVQLRLTNMSNTTVDGTWMVFGFIKG